MFVPPSKPEGFENRIYTADTYTTSPDNINTEACQYNYTEQVLRYIASFPGLCIAFVACSTKLSLGTKLALELVQEVGTHYIFYTGKV